MAPVPIVPPPPSPEVVDSVRTWGSWLIGSAASLIAFFKVGNVMIEKKIKTTVDFSALTLRLDHISDTQERSLTNQEMLVARMGQQDDAIREIAEDVSYLKGISNGQKVIHP